MPITTIIVIALAAVLAAPESPPAPSIPADAGWCSNFVLGSPRVGDAWGWYDLEYPCDGDGPPAWVLDVVDGVPTLWVFVGTGE